MNRSRCKHKYLKFPSRENFLAMKNMNNKCNSLCEKAKTQYSKKSRILESLAGCHTTFLFAVFCKIGALERNSY